MSKIAILVDRMFEDSELSVPLDRLRAAGHQVDLVGQSAGVEVTGKQGKERVRIDKAVRDVTAQDYDALVIPGGYSPDHLRMNIDAVRFTRAMALAGKPVAAICHAPWMLIEADVTDDRMVTSWPSVRTDLLNAGARWVDREVIEDGNIITSRKPDDLPAFCDAILRQLAEGVPERAKPALAPEGTSERPPMLH
ncbi:MAG TPA: type 1 glutamine amidotransferase domain-containing protein [Kofleriaceae bacterium]|nr:type 1 glutamine amidotransferase domain-containing protein [Kofleriaceae bacterium]